VYQSYEDLEDLKREVDTLYATRDPDVDPAPGRDGERGGDRGKDGEAAS
jgi:hypothetical protein